MNNIYSLEKPQCIYRESFPSLLKEIPDPPDKLHIAGTPELLFKDLKFLCVIGSRRHSEYGKDICIDFISKLKGLPIAIVSGLALGIDSIAHRAALENNIPTIAVPGSGLHPSVLYPKNHYGLAKDIIAQGGVVLSEFDQTTGASPWSFPIRNRIMAALSHSVLIIEAEENSGTLITAHLALEYNRDVIAVPGPIHSSTSKGPHSLLNKGALAITSAKDLITSLGLSTTTATEQEVLNLYSLCSRLEKKILHVLCEPQTRKQISEKTKLPVGQIQLLISMLELRQMIKEEGGLLYLLHQLPTSLMNT